MDDKNRTRILCVDDEPNVLHGLSLNLRRRYDVVTAPGGAAALELLAGDTTVGIIISDMRMPGMDGAAFLSRARLAVPEAVRLLLTGQADMESAVAAVNEGQIFRFLTKPCPPPALLAAVDAAAEQYRLITAERVLLEQTLHGSIKALTEVLALTSPIAFGRATRIKQLVTELATKVGLEQRWQVEVAAMLSQLGMITVPVETMERVYYGQALSDAEQKMVERGPAVTEQLLASIPRLEVVREILGTYSKAYNRAAIPTDRVKALTVQAAQVLRTAVDFDTLEAQGSSADAVIDAMRSRADRYEPEMVEALSTLRSGGDVRDAVREVPLAGLAVGMVIAEDVKMTTGTLLVTKGYEVTGSFLERARNFRPGSVKEPLRVIVRAAKAAAA